MRVLHHPCHQAGPYGQRCSFGRNLVDISLDSCIQAMRMFFVWRRDDNSCIQYRIPLQLNCKMSPEVSWV